MKICLSSTGTDLDANIDPRFGRCNYFVIYDSENDTFEYFENQSRDAMGGAGIQAAQFVIDKGADTVISGAIGPNAFRVLNSAGMNIYSGVSGVIKDAIEDLKKGKLTLTLQADVQSHYGTKKDF